MTAKYQTTLLLSSVENANGTVQVFDDGGSFTVDLDYELKLPDNTMICTVKVDSATIWYNTPNINLGVNSEFYITDGVTPYTISLSTGLYSVDDINSEINRQIVNQGGNSNIITLIADNATQRVIIQFNKTGVQVDFTQPDTFRELLGFNSRLVPTLPSFLVNQTDASDNVAQLNVIEYYLIHTDLVSNGFNLNNYSSDVIAQILIPPDTSPSSQIIYNPFNPDKITNNDLIKAPRKTLSFRLTDQNNNTVNTLSEIWSLKVIIEYEIPI